MLQAHDYQDTGIRRVIDRLCSQYLEAVLAFCVSSGKTLVSLAAASVLLRSQTVKHVIVLTYSQIIRSQFEAESGLLLGEDGRESHTPVVLTYGGEQVTLCKARSPKGAGWAEIRNYLVGDNTQQEILVLCFPTFSNSRYWEALKCDLMRLGDQVLIIVDEGQFADLDGDTDIGKTVFEVQIGEQGRGARVLRCSGTLDRVSGSAVERYPGHRIERTLASHMYELCAPDRIDFRVVRIPGRDRRCKEDSAVPQDLLTCAKEIFKQWVSDGRPYAIIRSSAIKGSGDRTTRAFRDALKEEFARAGCASDFCDGTGKKNPADFNASVRLEKQLKGAPATDPRWGLLPKVVFVVGRGGIGYDSPIRTHLYLVGVSKSDPFRVQLFGRVLRDRHNHPRVPQEWKRTSSVTFFIAEHNDDDGVLRTLFKSSLYITSLNIAGSIGAQINQLGHGLDGPVVKIPPEQVLLSDDEMSDLGACLGEVKAIWDSGRSEHDMHPTMASYVKMMQIMLEERRTDPVPEGSSYSEAQLKKFLVISTPTCVNVVVDELRRRPVPPDANGVAQILLEVFDRFSEAVTLGDNAYFMDADRIHLTAMEVRKAMRHVVTTCATITMEDMVESAGQFVGTTGRWPSLEDEDPRHPGSTFGDYDEELLRREYGGGFRWAVVCHYGTKNEHWTNVFERYQGQRAVAGRTADSTQLYTKLKPCPEVSYYPRVERLRHLGVAQHITLREASRMIGVHTIVEIDNLCRTLGEEAFLSDFRVSWGPDR